MKTELALMIRRTLVPYLSVVVVAGVLGTLDVILGDGIVAALYSIYLMVAWIAIAALAGVDLFGYLYRSSDSLLLVAPWSTTQITAMKAGVHGAWMLIVFVVTFALALPGYDEPSGGVSRAAAALLTVTARALGIAAFFVLVAALVRAVKPLRSVTLAAAAVISGVTAVVVGGTALLLMVLGVDGRTWYWALGTGSEITVSAQYVSILPVLIGRWDDPSPSLLVMPASLGLNVAILAGGATAWALLTRFVPANFVRVA